MAQYEPSCMPFAVAVGTDLDDNNDCRLLAWSFVTG